jgi:hypothetical protein
LIGYSDWAGRIGDRIMRKCLFFGAMILIAVLCGYVRAAVLEISSGEIVLPAGTYTYDYVDITGGSLKLTGDVNIICNGQDTAYLNFTGGTIYNEIVVDVCDCNNGVAGEDGLAGTTGDFPYNCGNDGKTAPDYRAADGKNGYNLKIYANRNITIKSLINLSGSDGVNHNGYAGTGGVGGMGGSSSGRGGTGGHGGRGGNSFGGNGGNGGSLHLETHGGKIDFGSVGQAVIYVNGGNGGKAGHGGSGGLGGSGGMGLAPYGRGGDGGLGGNGGWSVGGYGGNSGDIYCAALIIIDANFIEYYMDGGFTGTFMEPSGWNYGRAGLGGQGAWGPSGSGSDGTNGYDGKEHELGAGHWGNYTKHIISEPFNCQDVYSRHLELSGDINKDCYIDFMDFAEFAEQWMSYCMNPQDADCDKPWRHMY